MVFSHHSTYLLESSFFKLPSPCLLCSRVRRYLKNGDLPLQVGIPIETHNRTSSTHSAPGKLTQAWFMANATTITQHSCWRHAESFPNLFTFLCEASQIQVTWSSMMISWKLYQLLIITKDRRKPQCRVHQYYGYHTIGD